MESDDRFIITPQQAEALLPDGDEIHTFRDGGILIGADWSRAEIITCFAKAKEIEIGGDGCRRMRHPIAVWEGDGLDRRPLFVEADMMKLEALEKSREAD